MKIERLETFNANAGLRNYLFIRLTTDTGVTGIVGPNVGSKVREIIVDPDEYLQKLGPRDDQGY